MSITGRDHPETSFRAAQRNLPREGTQRNKVLLWVVQHTVKDGSGISDREMQELGMPANTQRPRRVELRDAGYIKAGGTNERDETLWLADLDAIREARKGTLA